MPLHCKVAQYKDTSPFCIECNTPCTENPHRFGLIAFTTKASNHLAPRVAPNSRREKAQLPEGATSTKSAQNNNPNVLNIRQFLFWQLQITIKRNKWLGRCDFCSLRARSYPSPLIVIIIFMKLFHFFQCWFSWTRAWDFPAEPQNKA